MCKRFAALVLILAFIIPAFSITAIGEDDIFKVDYTSVKALISAVREAGNPDLVDIGNAVLTEKDLDMIKVYCPNLSVYCEVELPGGKVRTDAESIDLSKTTIDDLASLTSLLGYFPNLKVVDMCDCGLTNEQMEELCGTYPDIKFVWIVKFGRWKLRTDAEAFSTLKSTKDEDRYTSEDFSVLRYCTDLKALDLGHNKITDLSWIEGLTQIRILILADNSIRDISSLAKLENLEYLEIFMNNVVDPSPLAGLDKLLDLNVCHNDIKDMSGIWCMQGLERLWFGGCEYLSQKQKQDTVDAMPNTLCNYTVWSSTKGGWRLHPRYDTLYYIFNNKDHIFIEWDDEIPAL